MFFTINLTITQAICSCKKFFTFFFIKLKLNFSWSKDESWVFFHHATSNIELPVYKAIPISPRLSESFFNTCMPRCWFRVLKSFVVYCVLLETNRLCTFGFRYKEVLLMLITELLKKIQFRHNRKQLEELDDETLDDDVSWQWIFFLLHMNLGKSIALIIWYLIILLHKNSLKIEGTISIWCFV